MKPSTESIYARKHFLIAQYDPAKIKLYAKEIQKRNLEQQIRDRNMISEALAKRRALWAAKPTPYDANQLKLILYKRRPKLPEAEWNSCLQVTDPKQRHQQMVHDYATQLGGQSLKVSVRPKSYAAFEEGQMSNQLLLARTGGSKTPTRQIMSIRHNLLTPQMRPKTGLDKTVEFHAGKMWDRMYE